MLVRQCGCWPSRNPYDKEGRPMNRGRLAILATTAVVLNSLAAIAAPPRLEVRQLTTGPLHHFFGYIGHGQNVPWNKSGRFIVALRTPVRDHLPDGGEPAEIVLLDTQNK